MSVKRSLASMEAEQFLYLLEFLDECAADPNVLRLCGAERVHPYGGDGTPDIPEFAVCELAASLGMANRSAASLVADILDLRHRLPLLFACLRNGEVDTWRVRRVAGGTRELSVEQAAAVDERLSQAGTDGAPVVARMSRARVQQVIDQIAYVEDEAQAEDEAEENRKNRFVRIRPGGVGVDEISGTVSSGGGRRLLARIDEIAGWLGEIDSANGAERRSMDVRRSVALIMLADHEQVDELSEQVTRLRQRSSQTDGAPSEPVADIPSRPSPRLPKTVLYVHLDAASGTWLLDGHGPITRSEAMGILGHSYVTVKPVIDLRENVTYTGYVAPPKLKEQTALANHGYCTFPYCTSSAWRGEYDHIVDYHARGPTDARNGHRLCKHHHRAKTFGGWTVISPAVGTWVWRSPRSRFYHVTESTTTPLELDLFRYAA